MTNDFGSQYNKLDLFAHPVGTKYPENALTNYLPLNKLLEQFNEHADEHNLPKINTSVIAIRDAIAHGRLTQPFTASPESPVRLVKFGQSNSGYVEMTFNEILNKAWFDKQLEEIRAAWETVNNATPPPQPYRLIREY